MARGQTRGRTPARAAVSLAAAAGLLLSLAGCAPQALGFQHDDTIQQGLPVRIARTAWAGVDLDNTSDSSIELKKLVLTDLSNATVTHVQVIRVTSGNGIGFYYPPLTAAMHAEFTHAKPLQDFTLPAHSHDEYEAVFLLSVVDPARDASSRTAEVTYRSGWGTWTETRHSAFCIFTHDGQGCDSH